MKFRIVVPSREDQSTLERLQQTCARAGNSRSEFTFAFVPEGLPPGAANHELATALPGLVYQIKEAERHGAQAVAIAHYLDPSLHASLL